MMNRALVLLVTSSIIHALLGNFTVGPITAQGSSRFFPETGHTVGGKFLAYWEQHGGLAQQGYPISDEFAEQSFIDGKVYTVQYFERAVFELHPENAGTQYEVLLSLLGVQDYRAKYPDGAPSQRPNSDRGSILFPQTGRRLGGSFLEYWRSHGGLAQQGYPISDEFTQRSPLDGKEYTVQYFERAVFEWHPENKGTPYEVLLSHLGRFSYRARYESLDIPPPGTGRVQLAPAGSEKYLLWSEAIYRPGSGYDAGSFDIVGLELKTNHVFEVADGPNNQVDAVIDGSIVAWDDNAHSGPASERDVKAKDLATGINFDVASGPADQVYPSISGRTVAWLEVDAKSSRVRFKDLDAETIQDVVEVPRTSDVLLLQPRISADYIVWAEVGGSDPNTRSSPVELRVYGRQSGNVSTVAQFRMQDSSRPLYDLEGSRLVWEQDGIHLTDLGTGEFEVVTADRTRVADLSLQSNHLFWGGIDAVHGMNLSNRRRVTVIEQPGLVSIPTIAGDWLVWSNAFAADGGALRYKLLREAFGIQHK